MYENVNLKYFPTKQVFTNPWVVSCAAIKIQNDSRQKKILSPQICKNTIAIFARKNIIIHLTLEHKRSKKKKNGRKFYLLFLCLSILMCVPCLASKISAHSVYSLCYFRSAQANDLHVSSTHRLLR